MKPIELFALALLAVTAAAAGDERERWLVDGAVSDTRAIAVVSPDAETEEAFIQRVYQATVLIYAQDSHGSMKMLCTGTAFQKTAKGYRVVTAAHCTSTDDTMHERVKTEASTFFVTRDESDVKQFIKARVVVVGYQHRGDDFAILEIETRDEIPIITLGDETQDVVGAPVLNVASPLGLGRQVFRGSISMPRLDRPVIEGDINWKSAMLIQMNVGGGSSGSAVISARQRAIIAFLVGSISRGASPNVVAIPASKFKEFVKAWEENEYKWFVPGVSAND